MTIDIIQTGNCQIFDKFFFLIQGKIDLVYESSERVTNQPSDEFTDFPGN